MRDWWAAVGLDWRRSREALEVVLAGGWGHLIGHCSVYSADRDGDGDGDRNRTVEGGVANETESVY